MIETLEMVDQLRASGEGHGNRAGPPLRLTVVESLLLHLIAAHEPGPLSATKPTEHVWYPPAPQVATEIAELLALVTEFHKVEQAIDEGEPDDDQWAELAKAWCFGVDAICDTIRRVIRADAACAAYTENDEFIVNMSDGRKLVIYQEFVEQPLPFKLRKTVKEWLGSLAEEPNFDRLFAQFDRLSAERRPLPDFHLDLLRLVIEFRNADGILLSPQVDESSANTSASQETWPRRLQKAVAGYEQAQQRLAEKPEDSRLRHLHHVWRHEILVLLLDSDAVIRCDADGVHTEVLADGRELTAKVSIKKKIPRQYRSRVAAWLQGRGRKTRHLADEIHRAVMNDEELPDFLRCVCHLEISVQQKT
jgi:hypothetical protein